MLLLIIPKMYVAELFHEYSFYISTNVGLNKEKTN